MDGGKKRTYALLLCILLFSIYNLNFGSMGGNDSTPSRYLPFSILHEGDFDLDEFTFLREGKRLPYFLVASHDRRHAFSTFGIGPALTAFPIFLAPMLIKKDWSWKEVVILAKVAASLLVTLSCLFLFLTLKHWLTVKHAFWLTLIYGLATCVWSISSQELWQHTASEFWLALSVFLLTRKNIWGLGFALGFAFMCRPPQSVCCGTFFCLCSLVLSKRMVKVRDQIFNWISHYRRSAIEL